MLTRLSVHCAERMTATSNQGSLYCNLALGYGACWPSNQPITPCITFLPIARSFIVSAAVAAISSPTVRIPPHRTRAAALAPHVAPPARKILPPSYRRATTPTALRASDADAAPAGGAPCRNGRRTKEQMSHGESQKAMRAQVSPTLADAFGQHAVDGRHTPPDARMRLHAANRSTSAHRRSAIRDVFRPTAVVAQDQPPPRDGRAVLDRIVEQQPVEIAKSSPAG